jgi:hypothetical protein
MLIHQQSIKLHKLVERWKKPVHWEWVEACNFLQFGHPPFCIGSSHQLQQLYEAKE